MHLVWKTTMALAVAGLMVGPATAEWFAFGDFEPNTEYDTKDWMWQEPAKPGEQKVFFHVISSTEYVSANGKPSVNPNVGLLHTQVEPFGVEYHNAFLGVWVDCNGDGYVGMVESGLREYSSSLLLSEEVCPPASGPANAWTAGAHNYNGWVSELVPIVSQNLSFASVSDRRVYRDDAARVWGDFHRPDEKPFHRSCTLRPFARGTLQDTGGFMNYVDCRVDILGNFNTVMAQIGDPLGLSFSDPDEGHSGPLGHIPLGGDESDQNAAVNVVDCSRPPIHSGDTLNMTPLGPMAPGTLMNRTVPMPSPGLGPAASDPTRFTVAGQYNATMEQVLQDCDTSNDFGHDFYNNFETDFNGVNPNNKTEADWNFNHQFTTTPRGFQSALLGGSAALAGTAGAPADWGVGMGGTHWGSDSTWVSKTGPRSLRVDLASGGASIAPAYWLSFYAYVSENTTSRGFKTPGGEGVYGSWHCGSHTSGIHNGWNCDRAVWYINPDGTFPSGKSLLAHPGDPYNLRDVDCYDGRIGDLGIGIQPAYYGPEACA
ncbi:MAG TPA: hypothetical protein VFH78_01265 [Candidatus Thermoplasmatota archaeon]|nr:hypothetical protein [Candidatus Thermoplasmatota archaeon]